MQHIAEWAVNVAVVSEPYWIPTNRENWASDRLGLVAIIVSGGLQLVKKVKGDGYVITKCGEILLVGIYCPPNATAATLEASLDRLSADLQRFTLPTLICGDFNAKSPAWGSRVSDVRGYIVLEWATALGLAILNRGTVPTCVRPQVNLDDPSMPPGLPALTHVCDVAMPRAGPLPPKRAVYWWSDEIAQLRRACIAARRESSRHRRRRQRDPNLDTPLYDAYNVAKKTLQTAIAKA
ncbi:hypothetical protein ABMA28_014684 [Loxostege sticticalis]|uniref:Endonuclease/exonuclease/phosphatase domain-containing protein n=1 Tax=Loxostege sticticalis TaxID=481309 RepID=A0ABD0TDD8_LOXSC